MDSNAVIKQNLLLKQNRIKRKLMREEKSNFGSLLLQDQNATKKKAKKKAKAKKKRKEKKNHM